MSPLHPSGSTEQCPELHKLIPWSFTRQGEVNEQMVQPLCQWFHGSVRLLTTLFWSKPPLPSPFSQTGGDAELTRCRAFILRESLVPRHGQTTAASAFLPGQGDQVPGGAGCHQTDPARRMGQLGQLYMVAESPRQETLEPSNTAWGREWGHMKEERVAKWGEGGMCDDHQPV